VKLVGTLLLYFDVELLASTSGIGGSDKKLPEIPVSRSFFFARMRDPLMVRICERGSR
jgi:hypothetical protein